MTRLIRRLKCLFGIHGPRWYGWESHHRSYKTLPFKRECLDCGARWVGKETNIADRIKIITGWRRVR